MKLNTFALYSIAMGAMLQFDSSYAAGIRNNRRRLQSDDSCLSITDYVCSNKEYSTLCGALKKYELADTLQDGAWTLFAPSNEAFEGLSSSYADDYLEILKFHVLKETVMYDDLICMNKVETVLGQNSRTKCSAKGKVQTGAGNLVVGTIPMITDPDIKGCNGIIQGIDEVMLPKLKSTMVEDDGSEDTPIGGPPTNMCSLVQNDLFFNVTTVNEYGSDNIYQIFPGPEPIGSSKICESKIWTPPDDGPLPYKHCIGDVVNTKTSLYSDRSLTNKVAFVTSTNAVTAINDLGAAVFIAHGTLTSLVETSSELVYLGNFEHAEYGPVFDGGAEDLAVVGGTGDCDYNVGTINFDVIPDEEFGIVHAVVKTV